MVGVHRPAAHRRGVAQRRVEWENRRRREREDVALLGEEPRGLRAPGAARGPRGRQRRGVQGPALLDLRSEVNNSE